MYSVARGNKFHFLSLLFFITGELVIAFFLSITNIGLTLFTSTIISQVGLVFIPIILYFYYTKAPIERTCLFNKIDFVNVLLCIILTYLIMPLLAVANIITQFFVKSYITESMTEAYSIPLWSLIITMAIFPAIFEELSSRAIIISNYKNKSWISTCLVSGLFFGILHKNLNQFSYAFIMGTIVCLVVIITGSIFSSMIMHFTINASNLVLSKYTLEFANTGELPTITPSALFYTLLIAIIICCITIPLASLVIYSLANHNNKGYIFKKGITTKEALNLPDDGLMLHKDGSTEKIATPYFLASVFTFIFIVGVFEIIIPML
jgi:membrane protease YdiL (CAAX protease family)